MFKRMFRPALVPVCHRLYTLGEENYAFMCPSLSGSVVDWELHKSYRSKILMLENNDC